MTGPSSLSRCSSLFDRPRRDCDARAHWLRRPLADDSKCPPGSWFCADAEIKLGVPGAETPPPPRPLRQPAPPPPVVIYTPAPAPPPPPPQYYPPPPPPPPPPHRHQSEVGLNFHLVGAAFGGNSQYKNSDTGAGGIGAALRFRPVPRFALEISIDAMRGKDANGFSRSEVPISFVGLLYLNPKSRAQVYLLGGFGFSSASVDVDNGQGTHKEDYSYFGGLFGGGIEFRIGRKVALNFDVRGFVRGRTDEAARNKPEFTATDGRTTKTRRAARSSPAASRSTSDPAFPARPRVG